MNRVYHQKTPLNIDNNGSRFDTYSPKGATIWLKVCRFRLLQPEAPPVCERKGVDDAVYGAVPGYLGRESHLERSRSRFGRVQIIFFLGWGACSHLARQGLLPNNFLLFDVQDQGLDVAALLISTGVLIYQTRQEELSEERSHLMLQLNLLTEQKITKLISLVEELRTDLPNVKNRNDLEADAMKQATDPQVILDALQQKLDPAVTTTRSP